MNPRAYAAVGWLAVVMVAGFGPLSAQPAQGIVSGALVDLELIASGLSRPLLVTHAGDGSGRIFIGEQNGLVKVLEDGAVDGTPYLDIRAISSCCGERGLLGLAFHPDFADNGELYISYTDNSGDSVLERRVVAEPATGRPSSSGEVLLRVDQPFSNHNGGHIAFGPDGYLYYALGDGGSGGDPFNNGQNRNTLLGKLLRLDVDTLAGYAIPADNPYADGGGRPEIWAYGLRNPWRFSFDSVTGDLWIGDVGQNAIEEINHQLAGLPGGRNYGWRAWEGYGAYDASQSTAVLLGGATYPVMWYTHGEGCSVTGGYVYRGSEPSLQGVYIFGDFCSGTIWGGFGAAGGYSRVSLLQTQLGISSFGEDEDGNLYVTNHWGGQVYRLRPA